MRLAQFQSRVYISFLQSRIRWSAGRWEQCLREIKPTREIEICGALTFLCSIDSRNLNKFDCVFMLSSLSSREGFWCACELFISLKGANNRNRFSSHPNSHRLKDFYSRSIPPQVSSFTPLRIGEDFDGLRLSTSFISFAFFLFSGLNGIILARKSELYVFILRRDGRCHV